MENMATGKCSRRCRDGVLARTGELTVFSMPRKYPWQMGAATKKSSGKKKKRQEATKKNARRQKEKRQKAKRKTPEGKKKNARRRFGLLASSRTRKAGLT
jgi:hypothetical protein